MRLAAVFLLGLVACKRTEGGAAAASGPAYPDTLVARGNEPFWAIRVDGPDAVVRTPDLPDGVSWTNGKWITSQESPKRWVYQARQRNAEGPELTLEVSEEPCTDSMSGAAFPRKAVLTFDRKRMEGCAS